MCLAPDGVGDVYEGVDAAIVHCLLPEGMNLVTILGTHKCETEFSSYVTGIHSLAARLDPYLA